MAGDINNPRIWEGADFWTAPLGTELPEFHESLTSAASWDPVGLLSEDGATEGREEDSNDFWAWGSRLVRTRRSRHKRSLTVTCLEDNLVVFGLVNPGSSAASEDGVTHRTIRIPKSERRSFLLETHDGEITRRRHIPTGEVTAVGETTLSESAMTAYALTITIYPDATETLYHDYDNDPQTDAGEGIMGTVGEEV